MLNDYEEKQAGVIALKYCSLKGTGEIIWGHTTSSLCIGYAYSHPYTKFKSIISRKHAQEQTVVGGTSFVLKSAPELDSSENESS